MKKHLITNDFLRLEVDTKGRITGLKNRITGTEIIGKTGIHHGWRMVIATGRHTRLFITDADITSTELPEISTTPKSIFVSIKVKLPDAGDIAILRLEYSLNEKGDGILATVDLTNLGKYEIEEFEFPVTGGLTGFRQGRRQNFFNLVAAGDRGDFYDDILVKGLPDTGRESHHFVREHETAMFESDGWGGVWLDLYCEKEGLFFGRFSADTDFAFKIEKYPKEVPNAPAHAYPSDTERWLRISALHVPRLEPGKSWRSVPIQIIAHKGGWHSGADRYAEYRNKNLTIAEPPSWMEDFTGWTEILGKTYLGEIFHDYAHCADAVIRDSRVTGLDMVFYYGHSRIGAEGADFDHSPDPTMGGDDGFRKMVEDLHRNGIRIILLDHFHRWVNRDIPQFTGMNLIRNAVIDEEGRPNTARWWKETFLSCKRLEGPTPVWVEMCPASENWLGYYLDYLTKMIELGVDGLELDTVERSTCHSREHNHPPGADLFLAKMDFLRTVRKHAKKLNPGFVLIGETMVPETSEVFDGNYSARYLTERDRIYRYIFPQIRNHAVLAGNYAYDQVNKALTLGIGIETEIWGLRKTCLDGCPELAEYIGEVNRFRRRHRDLFMQGIFRDTHGAKVKGDCMYSVLHGRYGRRALVLRNPSSKSITIEARFDGTHKCQFILWRPFKKERQAGRMPFRLKIGPFGVAVILETQDK